MHLKESFFTFDLYEDYDQKIEILSKINQNEFPDISVINQTIELLTIQRELKDEKFLHLSLYDTMIKLIENGNVRIEKLIYIFFFFRKNLH